MSYTITTQAGEILGDSLKELESPKGSVLAGVQKLHRAASMLDEDDIRVWCEIQLGNDKYTIPLSGYCDVINAMLGDYAEKRLRVNYGVVDPARLATIKGIGRKTVALAEQVLSFEPVK
jgi:hypothetical protein